MPTFLLSTFLHTYLLNLSKFYCWARNLTLTYSIPTNTYIPERSASAASMFARKPPCGLAPSNVQWPPNQESSGPS
ncbi:hypothetical protein F5B17DRAFT_383365 [Nemania serpens]|nr:hypothetical protein F5B17DRAFT_383365 [Nemania serpens]